MIPSSYSSPLQTFAGLITKTQTRYLVKHLVLLCCKTLRLLRQTSWRTIETVEGGGMVILLLNSVKSLKQLYSLTMDVHSRFRTTSQDEVVPRFNERFILSLSRCKSCMALDDELNILPLHTIDGDVQSRYSTWIPDSNGNQAADELKKLKTSLEDTPILCDVVTCSRTLDQAQVLVSFFV